MPDLDVLGIALRALLYVGTVATVGGILFALSFPKTAGAVRGSVRAQIAFGCCLLLLVELLRYASFQLAIGGHDWGRAFGPDLRWMAFETPMGRAALMRVAAAAVLVVIGVRPVLGVRLASVFLILGSFLIEGHTVSGDETSVLSSALLLLHVLAVHWWLGAFFPLMMLIRTGEPAAHAPAVEAFGARAFPIVAALLVAGVLLAGQLTGWQLRLDNAYQQRFLVKIGLVAAMLAIAMANKLYFTPLLKRAPARGAAQLGASIGIETIVALAVLAATAWALDASSDM